VPIRHRLPVAERSACRLRTALQDMANKTTGSEAIVVIGSPVEFVHQYAECKRTVSASPRNYDVRTAVECCLYWDRTEIGVRCQQPIWQTIAGHHLPQTAGSKPIGQRHDVVTFHHCHPQ